MFDEDEVYIVTPEGVCPWCRINLIVEDSNCQTAACVAAEDKFEDALARHQSEQVGDYT